MTKPQRASPMTTTRPKTNPTPKPKPAKKAGSKPVKAWNVTLGDQSSIDVADIHFPKPDANARRDYWLSEGLECPVIPVTIVPGHIGKDFRIVPL